MSSQEIAGVALVTGVRRMAIFQFAIRADELVAGSFWHRERSGILPSRGRRGGRSLRRS